MADSNSPPTDSAADSASSGTNAGNATTSSPWSQIVRGPEPDPEPEPKPDVASPANAVVAGNSPDNGDNNAAVSKKSSAWNKKPMSKPSTMNGEAAETGVAAPVMGGDGWPSLAEGTKVSPKLSSSFDTSMNVPEFGSNLTHQVSGIDTPSTATDQFSVRSPSLGSQRQTISNSNHHVNSNHARPSRQKFTKRDGGGNSLANGVSSHQSSQSIGEGTHYHHNHGSPKPNSGSSFENSGRDNVQNHNHRESGQRNNSGEHYHRNSFRKGNGGSHSRGDGSHQNYRRSDQERGNHDLNHQRSFNGRDASMRPRVPPAGLARPPPINPPMYYPAMAPFPNHMMPVFVPIGPPFVGPYAPVYVPVPELYSDLLRQINYYFSNDNLVRDTYLRRKMDDNGWVHVDVIADFPKVKLLTTDTYLILEAVRPSTVVEVQGDKMRRRDDWRRWVLPPSLRVPTAPGSQSPNQQAVAAVTERIQSFSVDESTNHTTSTVRDQTDGSANVSQASSSGDSNTASKDEANSGGY